MDAFPWHLPLTGALLPCDLSQDGKNEPSGDLSMVLNYFQLNNCPQATAGRNMPQQYMTVLYPRFSSKNWHRLYSTTVNVGETSWFFTSVKCTVLKRKPNKHVNVFFLWPQRPCSQFNPKSLCASIWKHFEKQIGVERVCACLYSSCGTGQGCSVLKAQVRDASLKTLRRLESFILFIIFKNLKSLSQTIATRGGGESRRVSFILHSLASCRPVLRCRRTKSVQPALFSVQNA